MKIVHRVGFSASPSMKGVIHALGLAPTISALPGAASDFLSFDVTEDDPRWPVLHIKLREWGVSEGQVSTVFTDAEVRAASWLEIGAWHHGYPQPHAEGFGYRDVTFDLGGWCEACGVGLVQKAPFRMKTEPKWGRNGVMQLIWIYGELFVKPEVWDQIFRPLNVESRPVLRTNGAPLTSVVQLVVDATHELCTEGLASTLCPRCNRLKYAPVVRGFVPAPSSEPDTALVRAAQYFGSGGQAHQPILVRSEVASALRAAGVRGASFKPASRAMLERRDAPAPDSR